MKIWKYSSEVTPDPGDPWPLRHTDLQIGVVPDPAEAATAGASVCLLVDLQYQDLLNVLSKGLL